MAESLNSTRRLVFRESKILVNVDHASDDLLVVSYPFKSKLFQGILIDSTNRYLPCAYPSPDVVKWSPPRVTDVKDPSTAGVDPPKETDRAFYSLSNRFTYFQDVLFQKNVALVKSAKQAKARAQKMTVRLRPRQVLCSKCRSICNENSENVHSSGSGKKDPKGDKNNKNLLTETISNENQNVEIKSPRKKVRTTLVPKLSRLEPEDVRTVNGNQVEGSRAWSEMLEADKQMVLRKKRSVGSMEDLWDETVFEEAAKKAKTTPIIKISFGSPGEGTVVKIPSKVQLSGSEGEDEEEEKDLTESSKSLKKAMKKAKKEAKRKISPEREEEASPEEPNYKKHRHRVKHKKRHKNSKEEEMKDKCLKQKLSISLRRVCGPGEEESWSGESSRSSEAIKEADDTKPDPVQEIPSRVCENAQDGKVSDKEDTSPHEPLKKLKKSGFQRKKRSITSEDPSLEELAEKPGCNDTIEPLSSTKSTRSRQELIHSVKIAQTSISKEELGAISVDVISKKSSISDKHSTDNINRSEESGCITKDIKEVRSDETSINQPKVQSSSLKIKDKDLIDYDTVSPPQLINMQCLSNPIDNKLEILSRLDDNLEDTLISEDSMPELDETIEDALLESDKEMPESLENQRDISLRISSLSGAEDQWENEPEIPVLTRMVDPEDVEDRNTFKSVVNILEGSNSILNPEPSIKSIVSKDLQLPSDDVRLIQEKGALKKVQKDQESLSSKIEPNLPNDELVDSSGESEFLPAEDSFDCELPEEVLTVLKEKSSEVPSLLLKDSSKCEKSSDNPDLPNKCVHPSDLKTFKDCLLHKALLETRKEEIKDSSNDFVHTESRSKRLKIQNSASCSVDTEHRLSVCDEIGCEDSHTSKPSQVKQLKGRPSLDTSLFVSNSPKTETLDPSCKNISTKCHLEILSSKMFDEASSKITLSQKESFLPNFGPFPCKVSKSNSLEGSFNESMIVDPLVTSCSNSSTKTSSRSPFKTDEINKMDSAEPSPIESSLDAVPNFPDSSSQGAQEVTSCQAEDGTVLTVGDIVWAKIHGFPWWPAKVVRICASSSGSAGCDARVAWFGSATSSLMSTDQLSPFIQTFKAKYNRERKSTGYLEAIRQARSEASSKEFHLPSPLTEIDELLAL